jgi:hypothetical protein
MAFSNITSKILPNSKKDLVNSSTTPLSSGATFTGSFTQSEYPDVMVSCKTDNTGTLFLDFSNDCSNYSTFPVNGYSIVSGVHKFHTALKGPRYFRVRIINDSGAQSYLRLYTYYGTFSKTTNVPLNQDIESDSDSIITRSIISAVQQDGITYTNIKATEQNELLVNTLNSNRTKYSGYSALTVTADMYIMMIDLSAQDYTNHIHLSSISCYLSFASNTAKATIRIGVITRVDGTSADISYLINILGGTQSSNDSVNIFQIYTPSAVNFRVVGGVLADAITNVVETNIISINTGVTMITPNGTATPAVGDIICKFDYVADTFDCNVGLVYSPF